MERKKLLVLSIHLAETKKKKEKRGKFRQSSPFSVFISQYDIVVRAGV